MSAAASTWPAPPSRAPILPPGSDLRSLQARVLAGEEVSVEEIDRALHVANLEAYLHLTLADLARSL